MTVSDEDEHKLPRLLVEAGVITSKQLEYAERVGSKLSYFKPTIELLKQLDFTTDEEIRDVLKEHASKLSIGDLLVELAVLPRDQIEEALAIQAENPDPKRRLGEILVSEGFVSERQLFDALSLQTGRPFLHLDKNEVDLTLLEEMPSAWCREHGFLPVRRQDDRVLVAFGDIEHGSALEAASQIFGSDSIDVAYSSARDIDHIWAEVSSRSKAEVDEDGPSEAAVAGLIDQMIDEATDRGASDIHAEPTGESLRIRFREDGVLIPYKNLPGGVVRAFMSRLKVLCGADIAERRRHQGGRFVHERASGALDLRASFYVTVHGEKAVLRILNRDRSLVPISELGMSPKVLDRFRRDALDRPSGVILITGPTGSGKTTTLYSCVNEINHDDVSIITAEDPVEYVMAGISQCSLNPKIELTYEETLRHIVRQDPDVIVIGEVRDNFSAETAIQAALTGHKVITTFHTEDTIGGLIRLLNMEIEAFLISSTVVSVLAQRLVRRVCEGCAVPYTPTAADFHRLGYSGTALEGAEMRIGSGCAACRRTGFRGRVAIVELLVLGEGVRGAVIDRATATEIRRVSREESGLVSLFEDGVLKLSKGLTTIDEILRMLPRLDQPRPLHELRRLSGE